MKLSCSRDDLLKEISIAQEVISSKNSLSVLSNVLLTAGKRGLKIQAYRPQGRLRDQHPRRGGAGWDHDSILRQAAEHPALPARR